MEIKFLPIAVVTGTEKEPISLYACQECGAITEPGNVQRHADWHGKTKSDIVWAGLM